METPDSRPESLLKWLRTFQLDECSSLQELSDGVAMAKVLHQIAPEWFTDSWLSTISTNAAHNMRLKVRNLKILLKKLMDYYQDCLGFQLTSFTEPNITRIGENSDLEQMTHLLQLILGCAIHCNNKKEYISKIMDMEEEVQQVIMQSIQDLEGYIQELGSSSVTTLESAAALSSGDSLCVVTSHLSVVQEELRRVTTERDQLAQHCHELDQQAVLLQEEKTCLQTENTKLQDKLKDFDGLEEPGGNAQRFNKELKKQVEACKEELFKAETSRDDYRAKVKQLERELMEVQARQLELQQATEEARLLKDELDILREAADKAAKHEATIESYKKKLEEYSDLKRRYKLLEDKNIEYMQSNMELEEEIKKSGSFKPQVEMYKKQVSELHQKLADETKRADKVDFENRKLQEKLQALTRERERLVLERDQLKESVDELRFSQLQQQSATEGEASTSDTAVTTDQSDLHALKEKVLRLEHENRLLKLQGADQQDVAVLEAQVEDLTQRIALEQTENRRVNQRVLELENQVCEAQERLANASRGEEDTVSSGKVKQQLQLATVQLQQLTSDKEQKSSQLEEKDAVIQDMKQKLASLQDLLARKDAELQSKDEKYKKCIEKAKSVIKTLDPKQQGNGSSPEVAELRTQIQEKDKRIESLEKEYEKNRGIREMEEKLMITAFNKFAVQLNRQAAEQRLSHMSSSTSASFLSRQRQPTSRRPAANASSSSAFNTSSLI